MVTKMSNDKIVLELMEKTTSFLARVQELDLPFGEDTTIIELTKKASTILPTAFLRCPIDQRLLDSTVPTTTCPGCETAYCEEDAKLLASRGEKCWVCKKVKFRDMFA